MEKKYGASVIPVNCEQLKTDDIHEIMRQVLFEFPITEVEFYVPKWVEMLSREHRIKQELLNCVRTVMEDMDDVRSIVSRTLETDSPYIDSIQVDQIEMDTGKVRIRVGFEQKYYYEVLSELTGADIKGEYELISTVKELASMRDELSRLRDAFTDVIHGRENERIRCGQPVQRGHPAGRACDHQAREQVRGKDPLRSALDPYDPREYRDRDRSHRRE